MTDDIRHSDDTLQQAGDYMRRSPLIVLLRACSALIPGEYLKTAFFINCIERPRRALRQLLFAFYRYDHVYGVLREFGHEHSGRASVLEFGTSDGYSFVKLLYATRYLKLTNRITVHTFDSFLGMPAAVDDRDRDLVGADDWAQGQFRGNLEALSEYCSKRFANYRIHPGYFEQSIDSSLIESLRTEPPVLIWIDSDYYSSARTVLERLIDCIPNGCVIYFDELDNLNYGSRLTGEARLLHEINRGLFGDNIELVPDFALSLFSRRVYRFMRLPPNKLIPAREVANTAGKVRRRADGSPLP